MVEQSWSPLSDEVQASSTSDWTIFGHYQSPATLESQVGSGATVVLKRVLQLFL